MGGLLSKLKVFKDRYFGVSVAYAFRIQWAYKDFLRCKFPFVMRLYIKSYRKKLDAAFERTSQKEGPIEVAFFLTIPGMWKSDYLFRLMRESGKYHPYVVVYPYSVYKDFNEEEGWKTVNRTRAFIEAKGFECRVPYDAETKTWLDVNKEYNPDVVIFSTPYKDMPKQYYLYNFRDKVTCYIPYGYSVLNIFNLNYNLPFHNLVGVHFVETSMHQQIASANSTNKAVNTEVVGYPGVEVFLDKDYQPKNVWKTQTVVKKKVIWAPHHTIGDTFNLSSFLDYYDFMLELAEKYSSEVQFLFKPHQLLKFKLMALWGEKETNDYYERWNSLDNTQLEEGSYIDPFITSDAMIHDCGSFTSEYLHTKHPVMYLVKDVEMENRFSPFGKKCFNLHYHGHNREEIERFIAEVVIGGNDPKRAERETFFETYLGLRDGMTPSERIMQFFDKKFNRN